MIDNELNWEQCGRNWPWPNLKCCRRISLERLRKWEESVKSGCGLFYGTILEFASGNCGKGKDVKEVVVAYFMVLS
jgi:hypothetical protein